MLNEYVFNINICENYISDPNMADQTYLTWKSYLYLQLWKPNSVASNIIFQTTKTSSVNESWNELDTTTKYQWNTHIKIPKKKKNQLSWPTNLLLDDSHQ